MFSDLQECNQCLAKIKAIIKTDDSKKKYLVVYYTNTCDGQIKIWKVTYKTEKQ